MKYNFIFLVDHPFDLVLFLGLKYSLSNVFKFNSICIFTNHPYFKSSREYINYLSFFDEVIETERPFHGRNFYKSYIRSKEFIKILRHLNLKKNTIYFTANRSELTTQLIEKYSTKYYRILQKNSISDFQRRTYKFNLKSTAARLVIEFFFSLKHTFVFNNKLQKNISYYYHSKEDLSTTFYLKNINENLNSDEIHFPFNFKKVEKNKNIIYFMGSRFLGWNFVSKSTYISILNNSLRAIENIYDSNSFFYYKKHPKETIESDVLDLGKFVVLEETSSSEMEYLKNINNISAVYSFGSTASKTAFNFGINSYVLYRMFNIENDLILSFEDIFEGLPETSKPREFKDFGKQTFYEPSNFSTKNLEYKIIKDATQ